jgi:hypothetical protein
VIGVNAHDTDRPEHVFPHLLGLKHLLELSFDGTELNCEGVETLSGLTRLIDLSLDFTITDDDGLARLGQLTHLETLKLAATYVTDAGLVHLRAYPNTEQTVSGTADAI